MVTNIAKCVSRPSFEDQDKNRLAGILHTILLTLLFSSLPLMGIVLGNGKPSGFLAFVLVDILLVCLFVLVKQGRLTLPSYVVPILIWILVTYFCYTGNGIHDSAVFGYIVVISLASLLLGKNAPITFTGLSIVALAWLAFAEIKGLITTPFASVTGFDDVLQIGVMLTIGAILLRIMMNHLIRSLEQTRRSEEVIRTLNATLEQRITDRTRDLQVAADVSRQATQVLDLKSLLPELVRLTRAAFKLYHVSMFTYNQERTTLELQATTSEVHQQLLRIDESASAENGHGLIAQCAKERKTIAINDTNAVPDFSANPLLPDTCSEAVLPMLVGDNLIGVLDLQASETNRFSEDDLKVLTTLAEQTAIAVRNAQLFAEVKEARESAERANSVKSQFLASMSHELRTPLNAILNFTQFVTSGMTGPINDDQFELLNKVIESGKHLLNLINDVLDISKIEAGALKLFVEDNINLNEESKSVAEIARSLIKDKPVELVLNIEHNLPLIMGDRRRIRQIMLNLVSNACKFTNTGSVTLELCCKESCITLAVHDTGPGIAPEDHSLIFEAFRQTQSGMRQGEGTGLGLPISRHLAEAHGGRLWLESTVGQGSSFYVSLPIRPDRLIPLLKVKSEANNAN